MVSGGANPQICLRAYDTSDAHLALARKSNGFAWMLLPPGPPPENIHLKTYIGGLLLGQPPGPQGANPPPPPPPPPRTPRCRSACMRLIDKNAQIKIGLNIGETWEECNSTWKLSIPVLKRMLSFVFHTSNFVKAVVKMFCEFMQNEEDALQIRPPLIFVSVAFLFFLSFSFLFFFSSHG